MKNTWIFFLVANLFCFSTPSQAQENECVILVHGLARTNFSMLKLAWALKKNHYLVVNNTYPSTKKTIGALAEEYIPAMVNQCLRYNAKRIHFVTHSIGGIVLQRYLQNHSISRLSTIVMLAPPNHGSPWADLLHDKWIFRFIFGPAFSELTTIREVPELDSQYKIGVIAGNVNYNPFLGILFDEPNDGKVTVSSTKLNTMKDFIVLPINHTFIMVSNRVENQILYFLNHGSFLKEHS